MYLYINPSFLLSNYISIHLLIAISTAMIDIMAARAHMWIDRVFGFRTWHTTLRLKLEMCALCCELCLVSAIPYNSHSYSADKVAKHKQ